MTDLRAAAQQALEALDGLSEPYHVLKAQDALRAALAQEEQEPVTWGVDWGRDGDRPCCTIIKRHADGTYEVVAVEYAPPRREWRGLTEEEISAVDWDANGTLHDYARAIEARLRELNNG